jgi:hypothetical protein
VIEYAEWAVEYLVDNESVRFEARDEDDAREFRAKVDGGGFLPWRCSPSGTIEEPIVTTPSSPSSCTS